MFNVSNQNPEKPIALHFHTCAEQSPKCLIPDAMGPCSHHWCLMAYKKPQYFGISIAEFYNRFEFSEFDICGGSFSAPHIIPHNPHEKGTTERGEFEGFRQAMNAVIHLAGEWPTDLKIVAKEHVQFRWTEFMDSIPSFNYDTLRNIWIDRLDVQEYAYYVGPLDNLVTHEVDVNAVYDRPDYLKGKIDDRPEDWCHCASESYWCGDNCRQPQNKDAVSSLMKGGRPC